MTRCSSSLTAISNRRTRTCALAKIRFTRNPYRLCRLLFLRHSPQLLAETDRDFLLSRENSAVSVWYSIAAARLDRKTAARTLHAAYDHSNGTWGGFSRAILVLELWNLQGPRETRFILDWFYDPSSGPGLFSAIHGIVC